MINLIQLKSYLKGNIWENKKPYGDIMEIVHMMKKIIKLKTKNTYFNILMHFTSKHISLDFNKKYAFIFFAADYNNLGDIAITCSQEKFLKNILGNKYIIIKVCVSDTLCYLNEIVKLPKENVLITMIGGGNNGSLYEFIEGMRRFLLYKMKDYRIVSFPQSVFYDSTYIGHLYQKEFIRLCEKCKDLTLTARETRSFLFYKKIKKIRPLLSPDIVFSFNYENSPERVKGKIALIFRNDIEKSLTINTQNSIINFVKNNFKEICYCDTCDIDYSKIEASELLNLYLNNISTMQLAITDRLHGMILCYITGTPCLVFDNNNGKIKDTYQTWIKDVNFIKLCNQSTSLENIIQYITELSRVTPKKETTLTNNFNNLMEVIR